MQGSTLKGVILGNLGDRTGTTLQCSGYSSREHRLTLVKSIDYDNGRTLRRSIPRASAIEKASDMNA